MSGPGNALGQPIPIDDAEEHIFGLCLVNDWSARDIQAWEYQPLGPFLAKNFATTVSPWVVTLEALAPFRTPAFARPPDDPQPLDYLSSPANRSVGRFRHHRRGILRTAQMRANSGTASADRAARHSETCTGPSPRCVAHHTSNGCNLRPGDLLASGTVSGAERGTQGCLLELRDGGTEPLDAARREQRTFLADGDEVIMRGFCERAGYARVGFGECCGVIHRTQATQS